MGKLVCAMSVGIECGVCGYVDVIEGGVVWIGEVEICFECVLICINVHAV